MRSRAQIGLNWMLIRHILYKFSPESNPLTFKNASRAYLWVSVPRSIRDDDFTMVSNLVDIDYAMEGAYRQLGERADRIKRMATSWMNKLERKIKDIDVKVAEKDGVPPRPRAASSVAPAAPTPASRSSK